MTIMEKLGFWGSIASITGFLLYFLPQDENKNKKELPTKFEQNTNGHNSPTIVNHDGQVIINSPTAPITTTWKKYNNTRFGFSVEYPTEWEEGADPQNGDGLNLFTGDPDIDIRVYARFNLFDDPCAESDNEKSTPQRLILKTETEEELYIVKRNGIVEYCMSIVDSGIDYRFSANITNEFFDKNKLILIKLIKSFEFIDGEERGTR